jgi:hypothetical protein
MGPLEACEIIEDLSEIANALQYMGEGHAQAKIVVACEPSASTRKATDEGVSRDV